MDLDKIIENTIKDIKPTKTANNHDFCLDQKNSTLKNFQNKTNKENSAEKNENSIENDFQVLQNYSITELSMMDLQNYDIRMEIYNRFKNDVEIWISEFLIDCKDVNADKGMYKCSLETFKACISDIGLNYFFKNKYLYDKKHTLTNGGYKYNDSMIEIALVLYENLCNEYRKQFFIYDSCKFLGISLDYMYRLSDLHSSFLKKAHTIQEDSMRTALASGRSNVTAMAILLNHDYDYTRTTQVIHTSDNRLKSADNLPSLENTQDIVLCDTSGDTKKIPNTL